MKFISVTNIRAGKNRQFPATDKKPATTVFVFDAHETDSTGSRIPCTLQTYDAAIAKHMSEYSPSVEYTIPFTDVSTFKNVQQISISDHVLNMPDHD